MAPADLDDHPSVKDLMERLGLGTFTAEGLSAFPGRNDNWAGTTDRGREVFVKRIGGERGESLTRFRRVLAFERTAAAASGPAFPRPALIGSDEDARLLVFELVKDASSGSDLSSDDRFDPPLARRVGRLVGALHEMRPAAGVELDRTPCALPPLPLLDALPWSYYAKASAGTLEAWRLMQGDGALHGALRELRAREATAPQVPVHGDFRLDQLLIGAGGSGEVQITDWEEFRAGDAARDLGAFAGDWLYRAVLKVPSNIQQAPGVPVSHQEIVSAGVVELAKVTPLIAAFWDGYRQVRTAGTAQDAGPAAAEPAPDPGSAPGPGTGSASVSGSGAGFAPDPTLLARATAFAGWHLLDRMLASAAHSSRLSAAERAAAGIGRTALLTPEAFVSVLGWEGETA